MDWSVGQVLDTVRDLGSRNDAGDFHLRQWRHAAGVNAPLRGHKGSTWEGGIRVPTIAWWPGQIPAGTSTDAITGMLDILPTLVKLGGGKAARRSQDRRRSISGPCCSVNPARRATPTFPYFRGFELEALRSGPWKLHFGLPEAAKAGGKAKANPNLNAPPAGLRLFNLVDDPENRDDVAADHPEEVRRLQALAAEMEADLGKTDSAPASVRWAGCPIRGRSSIATARCAVRLLWAAARTSRETGRAGRSAAVRGRRNASRQARLAAAAVLPVQRNDSRPLVVGWLV